MTQENKRKVQCRYCIYTIESCRMARHIVTRHSEKIEEWIRNPEDNTSIERIIYNTNHVKCNLCKQYFEKQHLEQYGEYYVFCHRCALLVDARATYKEVESIDVTLPSSPKHSAQYNLYNNQIELTGNKWIDTYPEQIEDHIVLALVHETLHSVIHKLEGVRPTYQFDNLAHKAYDGLKRTRYYHVAYGGTELEQ